MAGLSKIYIGNIYSPQFTFEDDEIFSIHSEVSCGIVGEELAIDTFESEILYEYIPDKALQPKKVKGGSSYYDGFETSDGEVLSGYYNDDLREVVYGTPINYYSNGIFCGKYFVSEIERTGKNRYTISGVDAIGLLDKRVDRGGIYLGSDVTLKDLILQLFTGLDFEMPMGYLRVQYLYKDDDKGFGYIPYKSVLTDGTTTYTKINYVLNHSLFYLDFQLTDETAYTSSTINYIFGCNITSTIESSYFDRNFCIYFQNSHMYLVTGETTIDTGEVNLGVKRHKLVIDNRVAGTIRITLDGASFYSGEGNFPSDNPTYMCFGAAAGSYIDFPNRWSISQGRYVRYYAIRITHPFSSGYCLVSDLIPACTVLNTNNGGMFNANYSLYFFNNNTSDTTYQMKAGPLTRKLNVPNFLITMTPEIANMTVRGWLPYASARENLYQILFAYNLNVVKDSNGGIVITSLKNPIPSTIEESDIFDTGSYEIEKPVTDLEVTEHTYIAPSDDDGYTTLFDNTGKLEVNYRTVVFSTAPIDPSTLTSDSLTIDEKGCNYAVVSGTGILKGKAYRHSEEIIERNVKEKDSTSKNYNDDRIISVTNATLITAANSETVIEKLANYYGHANTVNNAIIQKYQRCGTYYSFTDPFGEPAEGFLSKMSIDTSTFNRAECEIRVGYNPVTESTGNYYTHSVVLTSTELSTWNVPLTVLANKSKMRFTLVSGGHGGQSGTKGKAGTTYSSRFKYAGIGGAGGKAGEPGVGGYIRTFEIDTNVDNPVTSYTFRCGIGGAGGNVCTSEDTPNEGYEGTHTLIYDSTNGVKSTYGDFDTIEAHDAATSPGSNQGALSPDGYVNIFTGDVYGADNTVSGVDGGSGMQYSGSVLYGPTSTVISEYGANFPGTNLIKIGVAFEPEAHTIEAIRIVDKTYYAQTIAGPVALFTVPTVEKYQAVYYTYKVYTVFSGSGGGAAAGSNGGKGTDSSNGYGGTGGKGADALKPSQNKNYGYGGRGGNGGGGGGGAGLSTNYSYYGTPGQGGNGSEGGQGGNGCIIIYY